MEVVTELAVEVVSEDNEVQEVVANDVAKAEKETTAAPKEGNYIENILNFTKLEVH